MPVGSGVSLSIICPWQRALSPLIEYIFITPAIYQRFSSLLNYNLKTLRLKALQKNKKRATSPN